MENWSIFLKIKWSIIMNWLTSIFGVHKELIQLIGHSGWKTFSIDLHFTGISNFSLANVYLERGVRDVLSMTVNIYQIITNFTWCKWNAYRKKDHKIVSNAQNLQIIIMLAKAILTGDKLFIIKSQKTTEIYFFSRMWKSFEA